MNDRGHAGIELALGVGLLLLPVALAVLSFGPWSERKVLAEAGAAEAARTAVLELSTSSGASVLAEMAANHGLEPSEVKVGWCGGTPAAPGLPGAFCSFGRGSMVSAAVEIRVPLVRTPWGDVGGLWVTADHSEPVDLYRSLP